MSLNKKKEITDRIWAHSKTSGANKLMLLALTELADDDGFCWPSYETLGNMVGLTGSPDSIKRCALNNLAPLIERNEVIAWKQQGKKGGRGFTNIYLIAVGLKDEQIKEIVKRRFELQDSEVDSVLAKEGEEYTRLCTDRRVSSEALERTRDTKKGDTSIQHSQPMGDKSITDNSIKGDTSIQDDKQKGDRLDTRSINPLNPESTPTKESKLDSSPNGEGSPPLPKEEVIKVEYTPFLRDFLARFNAKRFRNPTQFKTVSDLVDQHGEAELESLAEWAANKGMGLGQAIPAIKSALKNPKRKAPDKSEDVPYVTPPDPIPPPARTPEQLIWQQVLADSPQIPQWLAAEIKPIPRSNGTFKLAVSSDSAKQWIDNRLVKVIKPTLNRIDQSISEIEVIVQ